MEMELGNMLNGNSRGEYPLKRSAGFEEELERLFDAYAPKRDNFWREYGEEKMPAAQGFLSRLVIQLASWNP